MVPRVTKDTKRVALFDHEDEHVALAAPLPLVGGPGSGYVLRLTEVHGRLGLGVCADRQVSVKTEVWVLGRQYSVQMQTRVWQRPAGSHFALGGYVLTAIAEDNNRKHVIVHNMA
jgi:hypothetical protein